ncbi:hypothetical protein PVK06_001420 [Gossypium arboreum]|uniref:Uncharacterized protein n=1 Tax=Gossypium arboreum TaxID=29729 RepID=A0ABR0R179_GOSAR|nr:hypothetical protein PVK06_001420 [Gossypium arboreum]
MPIWLARVGPHVCVAPTPRLAFPMWPTRLDLISDTPVHHARVGAHTHVAHTTHLGLACIAYTTTLEPPHGPHQNLNIDITKPRFSITYEHSIKINSQTKTLQHQQRIQKSYRRRIELRTLRMLQEP